MELRTLKSFVQVAESRSFSRASLVLQIAQPALSRQIKKLEDELGVELLYRNGRGAILTPAGEVLLENGRQLIADLEATKNEVQTAGGKFFGSASIAMPESVGRVLGVSLVERVQRQYPGLRLRITESFSGHVVDWLSSGRCDVGVIYEQTSTASIIAEPTVEEDLMLLCASELLPAAAVDGTIPFAALDGLPLALPGPAHSLRTELADAASEAGIKLDVRFEIESLHTMVATARQGLAYTVLPLCGALEVIDSGDLIALRIVAPQLSRVLHVATASQRQSAAASRHVAQILRDLMHEKSASGVWRKYDAALQKTA